MSIPKVHPTAIISDNAQLGKNVEIGAYAIIGDNVVIGDNCQVMHHGVIDQNTTIGNNCKIFPYCSLGTDPQDVTFKGEPTYVIIGENNTIREFTTINRGTVKGGGYTRIGHDNYFMAYVHIAHDCQVGNHVTFMNGATLAGHVEIDDYVVISAFSSVHQFTRIGRNAYIGGYSIILQDILPYAKVASSRDAYSFYGPNAIGMMRNGFTRDFIDHVKEIFHLFFRANLNTSQAIEKVENEYGDSEAVKEIVEFIKKSKRGILKNFF